MASDTEQTGGDSGLSKAVWHYISVGVLWIGLLFTGVAFERLGLTTSYLTGLLPGEVNTLKTQIAEYESMNQNLTHERDQAVKTSDTRELELSKLRRVVQELEAEIDTLKAAPAATPTPAAS
jgi:hypothetical protein